MLDLGGGRSGDRVEVGTELLSDLLGFQACRFFRFAFGVRFCLTLGFCLRPAAVGFSIELVQALLKTIDLIIQDDCVVACLQLIKTSRILDYTQLII